MTPSIVLPQILDRIRHDQQIVDDYYAYDENLTALAKRHGETHAYITRVLHRHGVTVSQARGRQLPEESQWGIYLLCRNGFSMPELERLTGWKRGGLMPSVKRVEARIRVAEEATFNYSRQTPYS